MEMQDVSVMLLTRVLVWRRFRKTDKSLLSDERRIGKRGLRVKHTMYFSLPNLGTKNVDFI
jgi:hypothetical protein